MTNHDPTAKTHRPDENRGAGDARDDDFAESSVFKKPAPRAWAVSLVAHVAAFASLGVVGTYVGVRAGVIPPSIVEFDAPPRRPPPQAPPPPPPRPAPAQPEAARQPSHAARPSAHHDRPARAGHVAAPHVLAAQGSGNGGGDEMPVGDNNDFQGGAVGGGGGAPVAPPTPEPEPPVHAATGRRGPVQLPEEAVPPEALDRPMPAYPETSRRNGVQAEVVARVVVDEDGAVTAVEILRGHPDFDTLVRDALRRWRYRPATVDGQALAVYQIVRVPFRLENL